MLCNQLSCCQVGTPSFLHRVKLVPGQSNCFYIKHSTSPLYARV